MPSLADLPSDAVALFEALQPVATEVEVRASEEAPLEVVDYDPGDDSADAPFTPPGTITVFVARKGSPWLKKLRGALGARDGAALQKLRGDLVTPSFEGRKAVELREAARTVAAEPVIGEVRYRGTPVARALFAPPDVDACGVGLPYTGGRVRKKELTLVQYVRDRARERLDAVAVRHAPSLSEAEAAALKMIPADDRSQHVGTAFLCYAITAVTVFLSTVIAATSLCPVRKVEAQRLSGKDVRRLGPGGTARELLRMRRKALGLG